MTEYYLNCNVPKCHKELKTQAWITFCSHSFCMDHGRDAVDKAKCPTCNTMFANKYDIVVMDLNPGEQYKTMILAGLSPDKVLDIANRALTFWVYQVYQEKIMSDSALRNAKQHYAEMSDYCEGLRTNHKVELQKLYREKEFCLKESEDKSKKIQDLISQLTEKSRLTKNLQSQIDTLKRSLANSSQNNEHCNQLYSEKMDYDNFRSNSSMSIQRRTQGSAINKKHITDKGHNNDFIFNPVVSPNFSKDYSFKFK